MWKRRKSNKYFPSGFSVSKTVLSIMNMKIKQTQSTSEIYGFDIFEAQGPVKEIDMLRNNYATVYGVL